MGWVAFDRGSPARARRAASSELAERWEAEASAVQAEILEQRRQSERGVFRQHYDTDALDASTLLMPLVRFLPPDDERVRATVLAIADELTEHGLVLRYRPDETEDGLDGQGGHVHDLLVLARLGAVGDRRAQAGAEALRARAHRMRPRSASTRRRSTRLSGAQLGNFPQAFTHLALINAVSHVIADEQMGEREEPSGVFTELRAAGAAG